MPPVAAAVDSRQWKRDGLARALPFALYIGFLALAPLLAPRMADARWLYGLQIGMVALPWISRSPGNGFDPTNPDGGLNVALVALQIIGAAIVIPVMEELFWRSYVLRWIERRENGIALGPAGTGKTHTALALGLAACQRNHSVLFVMAAALVHELMEAHDERRLRSLQKQLAKVNLLIVGELGYVPFTAVGSELLFEVISRRYENGATLVTSNRPFDEWTSVFGSERLAGALLDRLTHHVHILEMNGESYRLATSKKRARKASAIAAPDASVHGPAEPKGGATDVD